MLIDDVERTIRQSPGLTATEIAQAMFGESGYQERINSACHLLMKQGRIERNGKGGPGHPFTYNPL
jgi:hypothetical protein